MITWKRGEGKILRTNFHASEFECQCGKCQDQMIDALLIDQLQALRQRLGKPIKINSGYRCAAHNKAVGGKPDSQHLEGKAADIAVLDVETALIPVHAAWIGFTGIGIDKAFTHLDVREDRAVWRY